MTNNTTFRKAADRTRQSAFVLPMFLVYASLLVISLFIMREDIMTSLWGYQALPTQSGFPMTEWAVAFLPSIGQLAMGYIGIALMDSREDKKWMIISWVIWVLLFLVDTYTDLYFRNGFSWNVDVEVMLTSLFQTISIFTLGSELFFVLGFGMMFELLPDTIVEFFGLGRKIKSSWNGRIDLAQATLQQRENQQQRNNNQQNQQNNRRVN